MTEYVINYLIWTHFKLFVVTVMLGTPLWFCTVKPATAFGCITPLVKKVNHE